MSKRKSKPQVQIVGYLAVSPFDGYFGPFKTMRQAEIVCEKQDIRLARKQASIEDGAKLTKLQEHSLVRGLHKSNLYWSVKTLFHPQSLTAIGIP